MPKHVAVISILAMTFRNNHLIYSWLQNHFVIIVIDNFVVMDRSLLKKTFTRIIPTRNL